MNTIDPTSNDPLDQFGFDSETKSKLNTYIDMLLACNKKINLVGHYNRTDIVSNLLLPSLESSKLIHGKCIIDIGSGSGILGIPLKLVNKNIKLKICEKNVKKMAFIADVIIKLDIKNVELYPIILENIHKDNINDVEQLLIRGIKVVNIYDILLDKFPRGTPVVYYGSREDIDQTSMTVVDSIPMPGNQDRSHPLSIFLLKL